MQKSIYIALDCFNLLLCSIKSWNWWVHFKIFDLRMNGPQTLENLNVDFDQLPSQTRLFFERLSKLSSFASAPLRASLDVLKNMETLEFKTDDLALNAFNCIWICSQRLLFGISANVKNTIETLNRIIPQLSETKSLLLPCYISIDAQALRNILEMFRTLLLAKYALMESDIRHLSHSWISSNVPLLDQGHMEVQLLQSNLKTANIPSAFTEKSLEAVISGIFFSNDHFIELKGSLYFSDPILQQLVDLIPIQVKAMDNPDEAKLMLRAYKDRPSFIASSQFHVLHSIILAKTDEPIHTIKYVL